MDNMATQQKSGFTDRLFMNPLIRKLSKVQESDPTHAASYKGIATKTIYFLITLVIGIILNFVTKSLTAGVAMITVQGVSLSAVEVFVLLGCGLITLITPFLAFLIRPTIPVTGTLYCVATGYLLSFLATTFSGTYAGPVWLALAITILLVAIMAVLYSTGIVKVTKKFRTVVSTLFLVMIGASILAFIGYLIPATRPIVASIQNNFVISVVGGIAFIIIATLFLLVDFDTIKQTVENQLPKKYEWIAAFGLTFTVIWLYFKVLDLILRLTQNSK